LPTALAFSWAFAIPRLSTIVCVCLEMYRIR